MLPRRSLPGLATAALLGAAVAAQEPAGDRAVGGGRLRQVRIETRDVFAAEAAAGNLVYAVANALHGVTDPLVVRRELWFAPGDDIRTEQVEELERNLRRMGLFGAVDAELVDAGGGEVDLDVHTRDRFSLNASASVSRVGGVTDIDVRFAEGNLLGTGKELVSVWSRAEDERVRYLRYTDPQLLGSWHLLEIKAGETEEGPFADVDLIRPSKHLRDPLSWGIGYRGADEDVDYYRDGDTFAEVPRREHAARLFAARVSGPAELRRSFGGELRLRTSDYDAATGSGLVRVPVDTDQLELGPTLGFDYLPRYDRVVGLDTLDYVQDLALGIGGDLRAALVQREVRGRGADSQAALDGGLRLAVAPADRTWVTVAARGTVRADADRAQAWRGSLAVHAFQMSLPAQTVAVSLTYDAVGERQELLPQLTLGEDNGLRGYPARQLAGTRMMRLNVEDRIATGIELLSLHLGVVAFADVGWVHDRVSGRSLSDPVHAAGIGLRIGSSHLLGRRVLRIDVAWPLDDVDGRRFDASLSFAVGQVFSFVGNAAELGFEF